jgi:hypothetical protein
VEGDRMRRVCTVTALAKERYSPVISCVDMTYRPRLPSAV